MDDNFLYYHMIMNNPQIKRDEIEDAIEISEYDLLVKFKDGSKMIYDTFTDRYRYVSYVDDNLTDDEQAYEFQLRLRNIMKRKFINQEELAKRVGVSQGMISNYMRGRSIPDVIMLKKLSKALDCSVEDFYYKNY